MSACLDTPIKRRRALRSTIGYGPTQFSLTRRHVLHSSAGSAQPDIPDDGKLRLYSMRFCPFAQRAHLVLEAKKIPYHTININLTNKPEWLKEKNPLLKVPALEIPNGGIIVESLIVADYLNEKYPERPLYPSDPLKKAIERMWIERFAAVTSAMYRVFSSWNSPGGAPGALTEICEGLDLYEAELKTRGTPFFFGDQPGMLDYMIWPWCERSDMLKYLVGDKYALDNARYPKLVRSVV